MKKKPQLDSRQIVAHPNYFLFSLCDNALAARLFVRALERLSVKALEAFVATDFDVTFFAIFTSFLF